MTTTVKLIIELPTDKYLAVKTNMIADFIYDAVKHGIPLDSNSDSADNLNMEREQAYYRGYEDGIQKGRESAENKGDPISRQAVEEINSEIPKIHELFDIAYEYNQEDSTRTELSQKCTTYLLDIWQTLGAIVDNYPSVENKGEWIPVSERLPESGKEVLFCDIDDDIRLGYHIEGCPRTHFTEYGSWEFMKNVVAWQPLPEPYKEGE